MTPEGEQSGIQATARGPGRSPQPRARSGPRRPGMMTAMATAKEPAAGWTVELDTTPGRRQAQEEFVLHHADGTTSASSSTTTRGCTRCPASTRRSSSTSCSARRPPPSRPRSPRPSPRRGPRLDELRAFDLGAGNGVVGEELRARGVTVVAGADGVPEARDAAHRDRPGLYAHYLVGRAARRRRGHGRSSRRGADRAGRRGRGRRGPRAGRRARTAVVRVPARLGARADARGGNAGQDGHGRRGDARRDRGVRAPPRIVVRRTFRHRLSMAGAELHYLVLVAVKE